MRRLSCHIDADQRARLSLWTRSRTIGIVFGLHHEFHGELVEQLLPVPPKDSRLRTALGAVALLAWSGAFVLARVPLRGPHPRGPFLKRKEIEQLADTPPVVVVARAHAWQRLSML